MKKRLSLALLTVLAQGAMAQSPSSITLFGIVDANVQYVKNGAVSATQVGSGGESTGRLGVRGVEDLGGGLKAGFHLETQVGLDTGAVGATSGGVNRFWARRSTVSLHSSLGELRLGRDTLPTWTALSNFDAFNTIGIGATSNLYPDANAFGSVGRVRLDNLVAYSLPNTLGGVYGTFAIAPSEGAAGGKYYGARLGYAARGLNVTAAYGETKVNALDAHKVLIASGAYDFGVLKLLGTVQETKFVNASNRLYSLGVVSPIGRGKVSAAIARTTGDGVQGTTNWSAVSANQFSVGYAYSLSKRTALYSTLSYLKNKGAARYTVASISGSSPLAGDSSRAVNVGIRHSF
ncbi:porin [Acidovorax sp. CCYZU-2555]|uniref:porin n=1 Tax=Acidovorax sp. CCYZU-2555 TaxID=2835042 RepID=UPI001BCFA555|nr:porin [Acidovorax sp. CCYZU-2555]MBS7780529.1 porin [Acidovorax sp. CCYZU-2555]